MLCFAARPLHHAHTFHGNSLQVKQNLAKKELAVDGRNLQVTIAAVDAGTLRSATCAFLQTLQFALEIKGAFT